MLAVEVCLNVNEIMSSRAAVGNSCKTCDELVSFIIHQLFIDCFTSLTVNLLDDDEAYMYF